jgi:S1-C subfamily serine protease
MFGMFMITGVLCVRAEPESIDLKALAKKARPAVMFLSMSDANGQEIATGTGFLISTDGKLVTNHHVIERAAKISAKAENGGSFQVEGILADDPKNDLTILKLKGKDLPFLALGDDGKLEVGARVAVVGSPLGLEGTLSEGIVSAMRELNGQVKLLQITAPVSHGSSGSPVINAKGDVVGIASALLSGGQALNFAVPVAYATQLSAKITPDTVAQALDPSESGTGKKVLMADPDGRAYAAAEIAKDWVEMLKRANVLVSRYPDNAAAWAALALAYGHLNFTDDTIVAYQKAIKIKPDFAEAWNNLGAAYDQAGRTEEGIAAFEQAVKIEPALATAWDNLGELYARLRRTDDSASAFARARELRLKSKQ